MRCQMPSVVVGVMDSPPKSPTPAVAVARQPTRAGFTVRDGRTHPGRQRLTSATTRGLATVVGRAGSGLGPRTARSSSTTLLADLLGTAPLKNQSADPMVPIGKICR
jgi:hypothetical protein